MSLFHSGRLWPQSLLLCALVVAYFGGVATAGGLAGGKSQPAAETCDASSCQRYSTAVDWITPPAAAEIQSRVQDKPLMMVHLSGNFAKSEFT